MPLSDIIFVLNWWVVLFLIGVVFMPLTGKIFGNFFDRGYAFSKILGLIAVAYLLFVFGELHILPFGSLGGFLVLYIIALVNLYLLWKNNSYTKSLLTRWKFYLFYELLFLVALWFWAFVRAHQPDINGLEKFMDYGFVNSILRASYFPPKDMWLSSFSINYYYFGHLATAVLIKLSGVPSHVGFNLMLATIFAYCLTASLSLSSNIFHHLFDHHGFKARFRIIVGSILSSFFITFGGNLHTIYTFFKAYPNESPVPIWRLPFQPALFPNNYWYPNATRFIYHTIHEFPMYSFVVSDLHGHVLDIPFVILTLAIYFSVLLRAHTPHHARTMTNQMKSLLFSSDLGILVGFGFMLAVMYMTNAWDGLIYFMLAVFVIASRHLRRTKHIAWSTWILAVVRDATIIGVSTIIFSTPFSLFFKPFASGIGIVCPPQFLVKLGHIGPFVFEADHCMRSPIWQLGVLWGFFYFWIFSLVFFIFKKYRKNLRDIPVTDIYILLLIITGTILIIAPEFVYLKDIYATYFRANTMFKLVYQSFMMLSLVSGYAVIRCMSLLTRKEKLFLTPYFFIGIICITLISIYPYFSVKDYYNNLRVYKTLNGINYLQTQYPQEANAINWINTHISGQPVMLEAQGDSYTDFNIISANTGLPTVLGWTVHEWLWRNTYDVVPPRQKDIQTIYETPDPRIARSLLHTHNIQYVFIGKFEHQKYKVSEEKFNELGKVVYHQGAVTIYKVNL